jgi:hypothetical protein
MALEMRARGWCGEFRWGRTLAELIAALAVEPVLLGLDWYSAMFAPERRTGRIRVAGDVVGGHELVANGVNYRTRMIRLKQSWGRDHGRQGFVYLSFDDAERLIADGGDVLLTRELPG